MDRTEHTLEQPTVGWNQLTVEKLLVDSKAGATFDPQMRTHLGGSLR
jgi:hypothetical protein